MIDPNIGWTHSRNRSLTPKERWKIFRRKQALVPLLRIVGLPEGGTTRVYCSLCGTYHGYMVSETYVGARGDEVVPIDTSCNARVRRTLARAGDPAEIADRAWNGSRLVRKIIDDVFDTLRSEST